jgi:hypothetical protein
MKMIMLLVLFLSIPIFLNAQDVTCEELIDYVEENGDKDWWTLESHELLRSDWLNEVYCYEVDDVLVVVAEFKKYETFQWEYQKYIFCNIPKRNWENFKSIRIDMTEGYGKKFHKYIFNYKCDCN